MPIRRGIRKETGVASAGSNVFSASAAAAAKYDMQVDGEAPIATHLALAKGDQGAGWKSKKVKTMHKSSVSFRNTDIVQQGSDSVANNEDSMAARDKDLQKTVKRKSPSFFSTRVSASVQKEAPLVETTSAAPASALKVPQTKKPRRVAPSSIKAARQGSTKEHAPSIVVKKCSPNFSSLRKQRLQGSSATADQCKISQASPLPSLHDFSTADQPAATDSAPEHGNTALSLSSAQKGGQSAETPISRSEVSKKQKPRAKGAKATLSSSSSENSDDEYESLEIFTPNTCATDGKKRRYRQPDPSDPESCEKLKQQRLLDDMIWRTMFARLVRFKDEFGHTRVHLNDTDYRLSNWVRQQRTRMSYYRRKKPVPNETQFIEWQIGQLNSIGFEWSLAACKYRDENGLLRIREGAEESFEEPPPSAPVHELILPDEATSNRILRI